MQKLIPVLILSLVFVVGCSGKKEERPLDKALGEKENKELKKENYEVGTTTPVDHYQRGFDAYKDIKEIRKEEQDRQEEQKDTIDDVDNQ